MKNQQSRVKNESSDSRDFPLKLNMGCGLDHKTGWVNVDALKELSPDVVLDMSKAWPWQDDSVDELLFQDILEHFTLESLGHILAETARVSKKGALVTVRVPNIERIISQFSQDPQVRNLFLYGATDQTGVFGAHKVGFTPELLTTLFLLHGFEITSVATESTNWQFIFTKSSHEQQSKKMIQKAVWFIHSNSWGGAEVYFTDLISQLSGNLRNSNNPQTTQNFGTHQAVTTNAQLRSILHAKGIRVRKLATYAHFVGDWKSLIKSLFMLPVTLWVYFYAVWKNRGASVFVCATFSDMLFVTPFAQLFGVPVVWNEFGPVKPLLKRWFRIPEFLYRFLLRFVDRVIVPSKHTFTSLSQESHVSNSKLAIVPCGRNIFSDNTKLKSAERNSSNKEFTFLCVSRFEEGKGQEIAVRAFAECIKLVPQARLILVGAGITKPKIKTLVHELGLDAAVDFKGFVEDSLQEISKADVCLFPSLWNLEGFGLVAIEAMALGKPVITFDVPPMNEVTTHKVTGLLVPVTKSEDHDEEIHSFASAMQKLAIDSQLCKQISITAQEYFNDTYTIQKIAPEYANQLRWAICSLQAKSELAQLLPGNRV